jgi:hypothetical protein
VRERIQILSDFHASAFEGYAVNYIQRNFWKVQHLFGSFEDALSEAKCIFYECRAKYGATVKNNANLMALYKQLLSWYFIDYSKEDWNSRRVIVSSTIVESQCRIDGERDVEKDSYLKVIEPSITSEAVLVTLLGDASGELKSVLQMMIEAPPETMAVFRKEYEGVRRVSGSKELVDRFFYKAVEAAGLPPSHAPMLQSELLNLLA